MNKEQRTKVYEKYNGHCAYCGKKIEYLEMQVDHIKPKRNGGIDDISNYNPSCRRCNHYKRALDLEGFRDSMMSLHERIKSNYIVKVGIDYGIVTLKPFDGKFYFEKLEEKKLGLTMEEFFYGALPRDEKFRKLLLSRNPEIKMCCCEREERKNKK